MELHVSLISPKGVDKVWSKVGPLLTKSTVLSEGRYDIVDLYERLKSGAFQLWVVFQTDTTIVAAVTTMITDYPQGRFLSGQFLGGDDHRMDEWRDLICDTLDQWGRDNACKAVEFSGRSGWKKQLAGNGYREVFRAYQRDL